jgi:hypothetical protein
VGGKGVGFVWIFVVPNLSPTCSPLHLTLSHMLRPTLSSWNLRRWANIGTYVFLCFGVKTFILGSLQSFRTFLWWANQRDSLPKNIYICKGLGRHPQLINVDHTILYTNYLGSVLSCNMSDNQLMKKIEFILWKYWSQFQFNSKEMVCNLIWKCWKSICKSCLWFWKKNSLKRQKFEKGTFSILFTLELTKQILVWNSHPKRQLTKLKLILPKLTPMDHESRSLE